MSEILGFLFVLWILSFLFRSPKQSQGYSGPRAYRSDSGIQGHYDFLEMHGFMASEERESQRLAEQEYCDHPERFKTLTLQDLVDGKDFPE